VKSIQLIFYDLVKTLKVQYLCLLIIIIWLGGCSASQPVNTPFSFVFIADTSPANPFVTESEFLSKAYNAISKEGINYIFHGGNSAYGGLSLQGIRDYDLSRHYKANIGYLKSSGLYFYTVPGPRDLHDNKLKVFQRFSSPSLYKSFNYGKLHIVMLTLFKGMGMELYKEQLAWLKRDLKSSGYGSTIFVSYEAPKFKNKKNGEILFKGVLKNAQKCTSAVYIFASGVKAEKKHVAGVSEISLPCGGFCLKSYNYRRTTTYYVVDCKGTDCKYRPVNIHSK
jgi:hypothetical protein